MSSCSARGVAGRAAAEALAAEGASVLITDLRDADAIGDVSALEALGADVRLGRHDPSDLDGADLLVASPGIPPSAEVFSWARERGVPAWGELELGRPSRNGVPISPSPARMGRRRPPGCSRPACRRVASMRSRAAISGIRSPRRLVRPRGARGGGVVVPAGPPDEFPPRRVGVAEPRPRPSRPSRVVRRLSERQGRDLRAADRPGHPRRQP